jgi:hypothetical protein
MGSMVTPWQPLETSKTKLIILTTTLRSAMIQRREISGAKECGTTVRDPKLVDPMATGHLKWSRKRRIRQEW